MLHILLSYSIIILSYILSYILYIYIYIYIYICMYMYLFKWYIGKMIGKIFVNYYLGVNVLHWCPFRHRTSKFTQRTFPVTTSSFSLCINWCNIKVKLFEKFLTRFFNRLLLYSFLAISLVFTMLKLKVQLTLNSNQ